MIFVMGVLSIKCATSMYEHGIFTLPRVYTATVSDLCP